MEDLLEQLPKEQGYERNQYRSYIFQPERVAIYSRDNVETNLTNLPFTAKGTGQTAPATDLYFYYYQFRVRLPRSCVGVKSVQLLSASLPPPQTSIPDSEIVFSYYKIPTNGVQLAASGNSGVWQSTTTYGYLALVNSSGTYYISLQAGNLNNIPSTSPTYWANQGTFMSTYNPYWPLLGASSLQSFQLAPMRDGYNTTETEQGYGYNKIFLDYDDLVTQLNTANTNGYQSTTTNDVSFSVDPLTQRIVFRGADSQYFYMPLGYNDPNLPQYSESLFSDLGIVPQIGSLQQRLGFSWDGVYPPTTPVVAYTPGVSYTSYIAGTTVWDWALGLKASNPLMRQGGTTLNLIFNAYANLCYSPTVSIYTNIVFSSTVESSETNTSTNGLLQVVPVNTNQLGVSFFQSTFNRPLRKVAEIVDNIQIVLLTDRGIPYWIPNGTNVSIELGFSYE
jgi:hypothetical protein